MPVCGYVVIAEPGRTETVRSALDSLDGCEVVPAENADLLILVTTTPDPAADEALRQRIEDLSGIQALLMSFGEVDTEHPTPTHGPSTRRRQ